MPVDVSRELYERYKEIVFQKSPNVQVRGGDPVRLRDWASVETQRERMGLTDAQIAEQLGLTEEQVTFIRTQVEKEKYRFDAHQLLYKLKGNRAEAVYADRPEKQRNAPTDPPASDTPLSALLCGRTLGQRLDEQARGRRTAVALVNGERRLTYGELATAVRRVALGLRRLGVGWGDTVSAQLDGCLEFPLLHLAAAQVGAVFHPIPVSYDSAAFEYVLRDASPSLLVLRATASGRPEQRERLRQEVPSLAHVVVVGEPVPAGALPFESLVTLEMREQQALPAVQPSDPFVLLYTAGKRSPPTGVVHSHDTLLSNAWFQRPELGLTQDDVLCAATPTADPVWLYVCYLALQSGACLALLERFQPRALVQQLESQGVTVLALTPGQLASLLEGPGLPGAAPSSLRLVITSGAPLPPEIQERAAAHLGCPVLEQWSTTEVQAGSYARPDTPERMIGHAGRPAVGVELRVVDGEGRPLPPGQAGHLLYRAPFLCLRYHNRPQLTTALRDLEGWFHSGDRASLDEEGRLHIVGRTDDA